MSSEDQEQVESSDSKSLQILNSYVSSVITLHFGSGEYTLDNDVTTLNSLHNFCYTAEFPIIFFVIQSLENKIVKLSTQVQTITEHVGPILIFLTKSSSLPLNSSKPIALQLQLTTMNVEGGSGGRRILHSLQQHTKSIYHPLIKSIGTPSQDNTFVPSNNTTTTTTTTSDIEAENVTFLQKKLRELDLAFEECQRGMIIPSVILTTHPMLTTIALSLNPIILKGHLEKYNLSTVDSFLNDNKITVLMGDTAESREEFANELNKYAKLWPIEIYKQTKLIESPFPDTIEKEISFWKEYEKKLIETKEQLDSNAILLTKLLLRRTNRVSEQLIKESEIELDKSLDIATISVSYLKEFHIDDIIMANDLHPVLTKAVTQCMTQFNKIRHSKYEFSRAVQLLELLCQIIMNKMISLLKDKNLLLCDILDVKQIKVQTNEMISVWETQIALQKSVLKDIAKRKNEKLRPITVYYDSLQSRLQLIYDFRFNHNKLIDVFTDVLSSQDNELLSELNDAYRLILKIDTDLYELSEHGMSAWLSVYDMYERKLEKLESRIIKLLENRLNNCKSADDMFRTFSIFNPLFFRPNIRNAVNGFRTMLVKNVKEDVYRLQDKFKLKYEDSIEKITAEIKDIPPLSGQIIWAKQIENQLDILIHRMEDVLGYDWGVHYEGKQLKEICDELKLYISTDQLYNEWLSIQLTKTDTNKYSKTRDFLLLIEDHPMNGNKTIIVNYNEKQTLIFKEVRYLEWLLPTMNTIHKTIPQSIRNFAKEAFQRYPIAMALQTTISSYYQAKAGITIHNSDLLITHISSVREMIKEAIGGSKRSKRWIKWDSNDLNEWVGQLSNKIYTLQERVDDVNEKLYYIDHQLHLLSTSTYNHMILSEIINHIQSIVDEMVTKGFSNLLAWVHQLDKKIEKILLSRLNQAIKLWLTAFIHGICSNELLYKYQNPEDRMPQSPRQTPMKLRPSSTTTTSDSASIVHESIHGKNGITVTLPDAIPILDQTVHEILISNQILYVYPPLEQARVEWIQSLHQYISIVSTLPRLSTSRFNVFAKTTNQNKDYTNIIQYIDSTLLYEVFDHIEKELCNAQDYTNKWLQYQTLWDASVTDIADKIGTNITQWNQLLHEIKISRATIETEYEEKAFGPIIINHQQIQNKLNLKYDLWQKDIQNRFGHLLVEEIKTFYTDLSTMKTRLETIYLEGPTKEVISGVEYILKIKSNMTEFQQKVELLDNSEKLLQKQRYSFPKEWLSCTNVTSMFTDMCYIYEKRAKSMEQQLPTLQQKIQEEDHSLQVRTDELYHKWESDRPVDGNLVPTDVIQILSMFSSQINTLMEDATRLHGAKTALGIDYLNDNRLTYISQEIQDLKEAWSAVMPMYDKLKTVKSIYIKDSNAITIRKALDDIMNDLRSLPAKVRSYSAVEVLQEKITKYLSYQPVLRDIATEALKERHWKTILHGLHLTCYYNEVTIGIFWDINPLSYRKLITDILSTAQGELALEQYLKDLRDFWTTCEVTFVIRGIIRLITGWDVLFTTLEDNLNALASLKQSPYFKNVPEFQEDTMNWETRLTNLRIIFEFWIEVQRKWVYLRGIFKNPDIKAQLPAQFSKFKSIDSEFTNLLKRVTAKPAVLELLQIDNISKVLERQDNAMILIQKALGEYLERQRQIFPRFYFVNNEDLVEIIGNTNEPGKILPHLSKIFAAITTLDIHSFENQEAVVVDPSSMNDGSSNMTQIILAMTSKEGENVPLKVPINLSIGVKEWLIALEQGMHTTLASLLQQAYTNMPTDDHLLFKWMESYPAQIIILASQTLWTYTIEEALLKNDAIKLSAGLTALESRLKLLSTSVLNDMDIALRKKCEQLLTEMVHQRDVTRLLVNDHVTTIQDFNWLYHLRYYFNPKETNEIKQLQICMSNATFHYGYEYLGVGERLIQTPLTDRCYLTLTQALHFRMGGNPFGPAGTGKTESVKMLGSQLGRFVLVFNCDSSFDYAAMGRIFAGLCQVGAWGCFDEFNRLEERILSAVSQQILTIQKGLQAQQDTIELLGNSCKLNKDVGIFVTMNPGYAGRSNLPDNLKQLFRAVAMTVPDRKLITQVMLFSQGIVSAEELAGKIVLLFTLCEEQLSAQSHYDFGLRALKSVLTGAGDLKRKAILHMKDDNDNNSNNNNNKTSHMESIEMQVLIKSACDNILPKLVAEDTSLFLSLLKAIFPQSEIPKMDEAKLIECIHKVCEDDALEFSNVWAEKVLQLKQVLDMRHGVMLVGPCGTGKSTALQTLFKALAKYDGNKGEYHIIDPKSIKKEKLFGALDPNTLEWTDGIFTKTLRKVIEANANNIRTLSKRSWIIFDGDVDPEWAENLNSVLDDNKILTLPSGDRLKIPDNVRIIMEVDTLAHATLATVSRCGMIWFASDTISMEVALLHHIKGLKKVNLDNLVTTISFSLSRQLQKETQEKFVDAIYSHFTTIPGLVSTTLAHALQQEHVMEPTMDRLLNTLDSLLIQGIITAIEYNDNNTSFPMNDNHMEQFATRWLMYSLLWAFGGSMNTEKRIILSDLIMDHSTYGYDKGGKSKTATGGGSVKLIDLYVNVNDGTWLEWLTQVPKIEIESHRVTSSDVVISTVDTIRHTEILRAWLNTHKPLLLCGPPGSGKTMTLTSVLESMPEYILASLNFSSSTTPDLLLKTFAQYCDVSESPDGLIMQPNRQTYRNNQWLVIFCDEINLPETDKYGTQCVIMFLRQLVERGGFWNNDCRWVTLRRIQFVGACNPPTDAGRVSLSKRFLRHAPLLLVDYPTEISLKQIYRCFNHALLKMHPNLRGAVDSLNNAMVHFYLKNQQQFTQDMAPQYVYSPRELSRWVRAMYEAMEPLEAMTMEELVRLWAHEALRLFHDRLITSAEKTWCEQVLDDVAADHFPGVDITQCLKRPMLYSNWLKKTYQSADREELRNFVAARLKVFYEEELDVPLVIFDDVLEHVLRIDNVLRHPMGHMLLVGESGVGKTVLSRFVAWMNGLKIFQIKANNRYTIENFDDDLRALLRRVGVDGENIAFIFDESNVLSSAFLERMNALLASGEVPGLYEGDDRIQLMSALRDSINQREGVVLDADDELWRRFTKLIQKNLHVIFTMNPASFDFQNRCTASPALFNRCVVDWFGTWDVTALAQVGHEFTLTLDTGFTNYTIPEQKLVHSKASTSTSAGASSTVNPMQLLYMIIDQVNNGTGATDQPSLQNAVVAALVSIHDVVKAVTIKQAKSLGRQHYISPRDYLDLIRKFLRTEKEKRSLLEDQQTHIRTGLEKLLETQSQVATLRIEMMNKEQVLKTKDTEANIKLNQMVEKQNEAEQQKGVAEKLTIELQKQNEEIRIRKESVEQELSEAEPALLSAKHSVSNIKKAQLDEVRALTRPPQAVMDTMKMVCIMMNENNNDWNEIRKVIRRDDFISTVVNFDPFTLTSKQVKVIQDDYLSNPEIDHSIVDRASKACGPLYQWAESQIKYATILRKIKPLRDEVISLQELSDKLLIQQQQAITQVESLENAIRVYKTEYASAIRETEKIQSEMDIVTKKVNRAVALLQSLDQEKDRWQVISASFDIQMNTLIGDALLTAAFLTYGGIFDHKLRRSLLIEWMEILEILNIPYRNDYNLIHYLSTPTDHMKWKSQGLMSDDLALENAILLDKFDRYPLIVDPSGQATAFILEKYKAQKIAVTSFLDTSFLKTLASSIRFGTPLLVNDVETIDPILNPILNKELQKTGGRTLIRLGSEDIDFSPKFFIILTTRNPTARFAPDLCSRVTLINFTVTPASLEAQTLTAILKTERPDVDHRRNEILRLQTEQSAKLRELEESLLNRISAVQGAILDDDSVINALEIIKAEAADLMNEVNKTHDIMNEIKTISNIYEPLANTMSSVYFTMEKLADVHYLYQFSLHLFSDILNRVLKASSTTATTAKTGDSSMAISNTDMKLATARVKQLSYTFMQETSRRLLRCLRAEDKILFLVKLGQIVTNGQVKKELTTLELDYLHKGYTAIVDTSSLSAESVTQVKINKIKDLFPNRKLDDIVVKQLYALTLISSLSHIVTNLSAQSNDVLTHLFDSSTPEKNIPNVLFESSSERDIDDERLALLKVILIRTIRPERLLYAFEDYITTVFATTFDWREHSRMNLRTIIEMDTKASRPIFICSEPGQDASNKVDSLSVMNSKGLLQVAMGSAEGYIEADKCLAQGLKSGSWVLLRNVHLCTEWLNVLEKRWSTFTPHPDFRLFLTAEIHPKIPSTLIRDSDIIVAEASTGIKANMIRFYSNINIIRIDRQPAERCRLYALLTWLNAVIQERRRYTPIGWTKKYEFNETDASCAIDVIDEWIDSRSNTNANMTGTPMNTLSSTSKDMKLRSHIDPKEIPWNALRTLLKESLYGGRIDDPFDQAALNSFVDALFHERSYEPSAVLVSDMYGKPLVTLPDSLSRQGFEEWLKNLPDTNPPTWIGLPNTAESQLMESIGKRITTHLSLMQDMTGGSLSTSSNNTMNMTTNNTESSTKTQHESNQLKKTVTTWINTIETLMKSSILTIKNVRTNATAIERCMFREIEKGNALLHNIYQDLLLLRSYILGEIKATNDIRDIIRMINRDQIYLPWIKNTSFSTNISLSIFMDDFFKKTQALQSYDSIMKNGSQGIEELKYNLSHFFIPEAFVTSIRQYAAQINNWNLEDLVLHLDINVSTSQNKGDLLIDHLVIEGAHYHDTQLQLSSELRHILPCCQLKWRPKTLTLSEEFLCLPLYNDTSRTYLIGEVYLNKPKDAKLHIWAQRGVALIIQTYM